MKPMPHISDSEWEIMKILWASSPRSAQEVIDALADIKVWHPKTVKSLLNRLVKKGAVRFEAEGKTYRYSPAVPRRACVRSETASFIRRVYDGALAPFIASFMEEEELSRDDLEALRQLLKKKGSGDGKHR